MVGDYVKERRKWLGLSQVELGRKVGVTQDYISKIETGVIGIPGRDMMDKLAGALDARVAELYRAAGVLDGVEEDAPRRGLPAGGREEVEDYSAIEIAEIIAYVESRPGKEFQDRLARLKATLPPASYARLCLRLFRAWSANSDLALDAYGMDRNGG